jgi:hypothetical protein
MVTIILLALTITQQTNWRIMLDKAYQSEEAAIAMLTKLQSIPNPSATERAYQGTVQMLMAEHTFFPWNKLKHFSAGSKMLDEAIEDDKDNAEIRLLRFACQSNIPDFLGYNKAIDADKAVLMNQLKKSNDPDLNRRIKKIMAESKHIPDHEKTKLSQL